MTKTGYQGSITKTVSSSVLGNEPSKAIAPDPGPVTENFRELDTSMDDHERPWCAVVGIGASAGGLEALSKLFQAVPYSHLTFVVIQHLSPTASSLLPILLQRVSRIRVVEACDGDRLYANVVYVVPPNTDVALNNGTLSVWRREDRHQSFHPIDFFFRSLAEDQGPKAVAIVLSGTGTDGTDGLKAVQANGGTTYAQDTETARFSGMPDFASRSGFADYSLSPTAIAQALDVLSGKSAAPKIGDTDAGTNWMASLLDRIRSLTEIDFHLYKPSTILRRIEKRSKIRQFANIPAYIKASLDDEKELLALSDDLHINVTRFFRNREFYQYLRTVIIPELCAAPADKEAALRVWVTACATGEEAYSIAILFAMHLHHIKSTRTLQVFATDISTESIQFARRGAYPLSIADDVEHELLARFFVNENSLYCVRPSLRKLIVFSEHNLLNDAPFSRMCLITCRNLLIYLRPKAQKQIFNRLHYGLTAQGYLALGDSESASTAKDLFFSREIPHKFYGKNQTRLIDRDAVFGVQKALRPNIHKQAYRIETDMPTQTTLDAQLIKHARLIGLVVGEADQILEIRGDIAGVLALKSGQVNLDLTSIVNNDLRREAHIAIAAHRKAMDLHIDGPKEHSAPRGAVFTAELQDLAYSRRACLLVINPEIHGLVRDVPPTSLLGQKAKKVDLIAALQQSERDRALLRGDCDILLAQKKQLARELATAHEDSQAKVEELQSTVEELETSREEMQSANEEITVVNDELRTRMNENDMHQSDLMSVLANVNDIMLLLDEERNLKRYSQAAHKALMLDVRDLGKPITHIHRGFLSLDFDRQIQRVHLTREPFEIAATWQQGDVYSVRIIGIDSTSEKWGTFIRFDAITKQQTDHVHNRSSVEYLAYAETRWGAIRQGVVALTESFEVVWVNNAACKAFGLSRFDFVGKRWGDVKLDRLLKQQVHNLVEHVGNRNDDTCFFETESTDTDSVPRSLRVQMHRHYLPSGKSFLTLSAQEV